MKKLLSFLLLAVFLVACTPRLGGDRDSHGCIGSAGYSWCEAKQKCLRTWEENCTVQLANPASVYCGEQGGKTEIVTAEDGSQSGNCILKDGIVCDEWAYYRNECPKTLCKPEQRNAENCISVYTPVCGWFNESIKCFAYPCAATYSNSCSACSDGKVSYYTEKECPK